jgi:dTDP-glucose 4,6-dehydratase
MKFQNVLVTGGCGFIGSNFVRYLLNQPDFTGRIINVDVLTYAGNPQSLKDVQQEFPERYQLIQADICDTERMKQVFAENEIDAVCHFAAESHVDRSISGPDIFIRTNVQGTCSLLEAARSIQSRLQLFHHVSTDEVFGSLGDEGAFTEETPYQPNNPYSASKAASDHLVRSYHNTYGLPITISNCSNNYGPFQFPEKLIPLAILNALEEKPIPIYGEGKNMRDWLYVEDHCRAIWEVMKNGVRGQTYNVGGHNDIQNIDIVTQICALIHELGGVTHNCHELITLVPDRPGHDWRYAIDCSKIERELGWKPQESFHTGLNRTVQWYLTQKEWINSVRSGQYRQWIAQHYELRQ